MQVYIPFTIFFFCLGTSLITVHNEGIVFNDNTIVNGTSQLTSREVILNIEPDSPQLQWFEDEIIVTVNNGTVKIHIDAPFIEYVPKLVGWIPSATKVVRVDAVLVNDFSATGLVRDSNDAILNRIFDALVVPAGINSTILSNASRSNTLINRIDQLAASQLNDTLLSFPPSSRRLLQSLQTIDCARKGDVNCLLAVCATGLTDEFSAELWDICKTPNSTASTLSESDANDELQCLLAGSCRARMQCSPPPGKGIGVDEVCQQAIVTEIRSKVANAKLSDQTRQMAFYKNYFEDVAHNLLAFTGMASSLADLIEQQNDNVNGTIDALTQKRELLSNFSSTLLALKSQTEAVAGAIQDYTNDTMQVYQSVGGLMAQIISQMSDLSTVGANLKLAMISGGLSVQAANTLAQLHLVSQAQAGAMGNSIWGSITQDLEEYILKSDPYATLAKHVQAVLLNQEAEGAFVFWGSDRGQHPRELLPEERYRRLINSSLYWVADYGDTRQVTFEVYCDLQKFITDTDPRTTIAYIPNWFISPDPDNPCWTPAAQAVLETPNLDLSANITAIFPTYFNPCKCFVRTIERQTTDPRAMDFVTFVPDTSINFNRTSDLYADQIISFFAPGNPNASFVAAQAIMNKTALFSTLDVVCHRDDMLAATLSPWDMSFVPLKFVTLGLEPILVLLHPNASERSYCAPNPAKPELWVQPEFTSLNLGLPLPMLFYQQLLLAMQSFESFIRTGRSIAIGRLPYPCKVESGTQSYSVLNTTSEKNSILLNPLSTNGTYNKDSPFGYESHTVTCTLVSKNWVPVYNLINKKLHVDDSVKVQSTSHGILSAQVLQTRLYNVPLESLPGQFYFVGYPGCLRGPCSILPTYMDPKSGFVIADQTAAPSDVISVFGTDSEFNEFNASHTAYTGKSRFGYDITEDVISTSPSLLSQKHKITSLMYRNVDSGGSGGLNNISAQRRDTLEGPVYQNPGYNYSNWVQYVKGDFDPDLHSNVGAHLFRQTVQQRTNFLTITGNNFEDRQYLPDYTSTACTGNRLSGQGTGLCALLDLFYMDFSVTNGTVRFYPPTYKLQTVLHVQAQQDNASVPYAIRPASSDALGRRINNCPEIINIDNKEVDFTQIHVMYARLPDLPRVIHIHASPCDIASTSDANSTGVTDVLVRVSSDSTHSDVVSFGTTTVAVAGCASQVITVTVEPSVLAADYNTVPTNTCMVWESSPLTLSIDAVRSVVTEVVTVQNDQLAAKIRDIGFKISDLTETALDVASRGLQGALATEQNVVANAILNQELNDTLAHLQQAQDEITLDLSQVYSQGNSMLAFVATVDASLQNSLLNPDNMNIYLETLQQSEIKYAEYVAQEEVIIPFLRDAINTTENLGENLTDVSYVFANAPSNFHWDNIGYMLFVFNDIDCPAEISKHKRDLARAARDHYRCFDSSGFPVGLNCLTGNLAIFKFIIYGIVIILCMVAVLAVTISNDYGLSVFSCGQGFYDAVHAVPGPVRVIIVCAIVYLITMPFFLAFTS